MSDKTAESRGGRTQLIVLLVVCAVLAIAAFWMWRSRPTQPDVDAGRAVADQFLALVREGQAGQAWASTTAEFKSAEGRESFLRYVKDHPALTKPLNFVSVHTATVQDLPRAEYVYRSEDAKTTVRLLTGDEQGAHRVDRLSLD